MSSRGTGNNRAVSTAAASSFLGGPGLRRGTGVVVSTAGTGCRRSRAAGRSRRAGIARPARRPRPAPVAGPGKRAAAAGCRRPGTPGPARPVARRRPARGPGGIAAVSRSRTRRARASPSVSAAMRPGTARTRARPAATTARPGQPAAGRRLTAGGQLSASRCASQPAHCRSQRTSSDSRSALASRPPSPAFCAGSGSPGAGQPAARSPQSAASGASRPGGGHDLMNPGRAEPGRRGQGADRDLLGAGPGQRPARSRPACSSRHAARETRARTRRSAGPPDPPVDRHLAILPAAFRKLDAVAVLTARLLPAYSAAARSEPQERAHGSSAVPGGLDREPGHARGREASRRAGKWGNSPMRAIRAAMHAVCASQKHKRKESQTMANAS